MSDESLQKYRDVEAAKRYDGVPANSREGAKSCGPWMAGDPSPLSGRIKNAICTKHGGKSRGPTVNLAYERCSVARRILPKRR